MMRGTMVRKIIPLLLLVPIAAQASEFNTDFLQGDAKTQTEISKLLNAYGELPLGNQSYRVYVNKRYIGYQNFNVAPNSDGQPSLCLSVDTLQNLGINLTQEAKLSLLNVTCENTLSDLGAQVDYNANELTLHIFVPDANLMNREDLEFNQRRLDKGITAGFVNYSVSARYNNRNSDDEFAMPLTAEIGANYHDVRFRANVASSDVTDDDFVRQQAYVAKPLPNVLSEAVVGESITQGYLVDSIPFTGVSLRSDREMLPRYKQDYTPVIRGVAETNSTVNIYQGEYLLYTKDVAAGNFSITDLPYLSNNQVDIEIIGEDGQSKRYNYTITQLPMLLTEDTYRYELTAGKYRDSKNKMLNSFLYGEYGYGFDQMTLMGAVTISDPYYGMATGAGVTMGELGAVSMDYSYSNTLMDDDYHSGHSLRLLYAKELSSSMDLQLAGYRFSSENFRTFSEAVSSDYDRETSEPSYNTEVDLSRSKSRIDANLNFDVADSSVYVNLAHETYWNKSNTSTSYSVGYSSSIGRVNYTLSGAYTDYQTENDDHTVMLTMSVPIDYGKSASNVYTSVTSTSDSTSYEVGQSGVVDEYSYSVGASLNPDSDAYARASLSGSFDKTNVSVNASGNGSTISASASGTFVGFDGGVIAGAKRSDSYIIAKVGEREGIKVNGQETNKNGYALVSNIQPYETNELSLNAASMPTDIQTEKSIIATMPERGVISYVDFNASRVIRVVTQMMDAKGTYLPLGTIVSTKDKQSVIGVDGSVMVELSATEQSKFPLDIAYSTPTCQGVITINQPSTQIMNTGTTKCE
ncbi:hypothetical protein C9J47_18650 [Photobacterium indicum]|uniref:PapC N-terminal domain-containing protein n=2 Tax=Photobacterium indicum TaxID=81447 RepID=A0A2T3L5Z9_9GAMM|nr:hypothetical protein C9J47_18650 [Photobacterium indicum]